MRDYQNQRKRRLFTLQNLDLGAIIFLLGTFTLALAPRDWFVARFLVLNKWYAYGFFLIYALFRNARTLRAPRTIAVAFFLALPLVGTMSSITFAFRMSEAIQRIMAFWGLFLISFCIPVPPNPTERLLLWSRGFIAVSLAVVFGSLLVARDVNFYGGHRFSGVTYHPNTLSAFATVVILSMLSRVLANLPKLKPLPIVALLAGIYCLIASGARADLVGTVAGGLCIAYHLLTRKNFFRVVGGLVSLLALFLAAPAVFSMFSPLEISFRQFDIANRSTIWAIQIQSFLESPWIGWGFEFGLEEYGYGRANGEGSYTGLLSAVGVLGGLPFFFGLVYSAWKYSRFLHKSELAFSRVRHLKVQFVDGLAISTCLLVTSIAESWMATVGTPIPMYVWTVLSAATLVRPFRVHAAMAPAWFAGHAPLETTPVPAARSATRAT